MVLILCWLDSTIDQVDIPEFPQPFIFKRLHYILIHPYEIGIVCHVKIRLTENSLA